MDLFNKFRQRPDGDVPPVDIQQPLVLELPENAGDDLAGRPYEFADILMSELGGEEYPLAGLLTVFLGQAAETDYEAPNFGGVQTRRS